MPVLLPRGAILSKAGAIRDIREIRGAVLLGSSFVICGPDADFRREEIEQKARHVLDSPACRAFLFPMLPSSSTASPRSVSARLRGYWRKKAGKDTGRSSHPRLTGRGYGLLGLSLLLILLGALLPEPLAVQLGLLGWCLVLIAWFVAPLNLKGLSIARELPPAAFAGHLFPYTMELCNDSRQTRYAIEVEDSIAGPAERGLDAAQVPAGGKSLRAFETRMLRRGARHGARARLLSRFPLGLWQVELELRGRVDMFVYPRPVPPRQLYDAQDAALLDAEEDESARRDWSGDFHGIRGFQPGDRMKLIHWPATARAGRLMVRQFDRRLPEKYKVILHSIRPGPDPGSGPDAFESALELLCGLLLDCRERNIPLDITLAGEAWQTWSVPTGEPLEPVLECLAGTRRLAERDTAALLQALTTTEPGARVFIVSDIPVKDWEHHLPDFPFSITCLSLTDLRIRKPGFTRLGPLPVRS